MADFLARRWRRQPQGHLVPRAENTILRNLVGLWYAHPSGLWSAITNRRLTFGGSGAPEVATRYGVFSSRTRESESYWYDSETPKVGTSNRSIWLLVAGTPTRQMLFGNNHNDTWLDFSVGGWTYYQRSSGGGYPSVSSPGSLLTEGSLHQAVSVGTETELRLYANGREVASAAQAGLLGMSGDYYFGNNGNVGEGLVAAAAILNADMGSAFFAELAKNPWMMFRQARAITYSLPSGGTTYNDGVTETAAANDSVAAAAVAVGALAESGAAADTVAAAGVFTRAIAEAGSAADTVNAGAGVYAVSIDEAASAGDAVASAAVLVGGLAEAGAAADTVNATAVFTRAIAEGASAADAVAAGANVYAMSVSEAASAADSVGTLAVLTGAVAESAAAADAAQAWLVAQSAIFEASVAADLLGASGGVVISNIFRAAVNDALAFRCVATDAELAA